MYELTYLAPVYELTYLSPVYEVLTYLDPVLLFRSIIFHPRWIKDFGGRYRMRFFPAPACCVVGGLMGMRWLADCYVMTALEILNVTLRHATVVPSP